MYAPRYVSPDLIWIIGSVCEIQLNSLEGLRENIPRTMRLLEEEHGITNVAEHEVMDVITRDIKTVKKVLDNPILIYSLDTTWEKNLEDITDILEEDYEEDPEIVSMVDVLANQLQLTQLAQRITTPN